MFEDWYEIALQKQISFFATTKGEVNRIYEAHNSTKAWKVVEPMHRRIVGM
jgi:hypothetical protein